MIAVNIYLISDVFNRLFCIQFFNVTVCVDCVMYNHSDAKLPAIHQAIGGYLKMAPYRQGGAGKGASLLQVRDIVPTQADDDYEASLPDRTEAERNDSDAELFDE